MTELERAPVSQRTLVEQLRGLGLPEAPVVVVDTTIHLAEVIAGVPYRAQALHREPRWCPGPRRVRRDRPLLRELRADGRVATAGGPAGRRDRRSRPGASGPRVRYRARRGRPAACGPVRVPAPARRGVSRVRGRMGEHRPRAPAATVRGPGRPVPGEPVHSRGDLLRFPESREALLGAVRATPGNRERAHRADARRARHDRGQRDGAVVDASPRPCLSPSSGH